MNLWSWVKSLFQPKALISDLDKLWHIIENTPNADLISIVQRANYMVGGRQQVNVASLSIIIQVIKAVAEVIESKK